MDRFIARENEIGQITQSFKSDHFELILLYGRRHVGKTELIRHCCELFEGKSLYYMCRQVREKQLTDDLSEAIRTITDLSGQYFKSFSDSLRYLFELGVKENIVVVLDEYPNARQMIEGLDRQQSAGIG